ncbi:MAG: hypothetical protein JO257_34335 [Deltaproteobacteria bacterium]|nr:hypothetical protein [Deltaproteobacteria bacterium]
MNTLPVHCGIGCAFTRLGAVHTSVVLPDVFAHPAAHTIATKIDFPDIES